MQKALARSLIGARQADVAEARGWWGLRRRVAAALRAWLSPRKERIMMQHLSDPRPPVQEPPPPQPIPPQPDPNDDDDDDDDGDDENGQGHAQRKLG